MAFKDIVPGKKVARVVAGRFVNSEKGTLGIEVSFRFKEGESEERMQYVGWCSPLAIERTMKTLVEVLGYNGDDSVDPVSRYLLPGSLNQDRDVELVVEMEEYEGKSRPRIKWINDPAAAGAFEALSQAEVKQQLSAVGFKAEFLKAKQAFDGGATRTTPTLSAPLPQGHGAGPLKDEDVPF